MKKKALKLLLFVVLLSSSLYGALSTTQISMLYVTIFNRASEGEGNQYWQDRKLSMEETATEMLDTPSAKTYFGDRLNSNRAFVEYIYKNTLNKSYADDKDGIDYWIGLLNNGISRGKMITNLIYSAIKPETAGDAQNQFINRVIISNYMADKLKKAPSDYATSTSFSSRLTVTNDESTIDTAKKSIDDLLVRNNSYNVIWNVSNMAEFRQALEDASANGENDRIVLAKGIYNVTSDGLGTLIFNDDEKFNLTIQAEEGLTFKDVILDGNNTTQIFRFNNTKSSTLILKNISVINGQSAISCNQNIEINGCNISHNTSGGFYSSGTTKVINSVISNNSSGLGGGFYSNGTTIITNSTISNNSSSNEHLQKIKKFKFANNSKLLTLFYKKFKYRGGGFYSNGATIITNSTISNNSSDSFGAGFYSDGTTTVTNSTISNNSNYYGIGGGFCSDSETIVINSTIINNNSGRRGGGFYSDGTTTVTNSNISENSSNIDGGGFYSGGTTTIRNSNISNNNSRIDGGGFYSSGAIVINSIFVKNNAIQGATFYSYSSYISNNIFIKNKGSIYAQGIFINNIFSENDEDINLQGKSKVYNNYIYYSNIEENGHNVIKKHNLKPASVGDVNLNEDNKTLRSDSPVIDKGLNPNSATYKKIIDNDDIYNQILELLKTDKVGNKRVYNGTIDIGAVEFGSNNI